MEKQTYYKPTSLLTTENPKTIKGEKYGFTTYILYLSPYKQNSQGKNICPMASLGCASACLTGSGFGGMFPAVASGRRNKTELFLQDRNLFLNMLYSEIAQIELKHKIEKTKFVIRLNGTSDLSYEKFIIPYTGKNIFESFKKITFYDYTKNYTRFNKPLPKNYHLTFSRSETNDLVSMRLLAQGINVAMVFDEAPKTFRGYKVVNGDLSDLRHLDKKGVIVGLKYKKLTGKGANNKQAFESGFAIRTKQVSLPKLKQAA
jgi:hypothetical protein